MAPPDDPEEGLAVYVVQATGGDDLTAAMEALDSIALTETLFLVRSHLAQSVLYHQVKRENGPTTLFVGRLDGSPKFTGMTTGALATLRDWSARRPS